MQAPPGVQDCIPGGVWDRQAPKRAPAYAARGSM